MVSATMVVATVPVSDLARAKVFYGETLGLTFLWENPASIRFRCGHNSELSIFRRPSTVTEHTLAHFEVTDLESEVADLEARGSRSSTTLKGPSAQRVTSRKSALLAQPGSATPMGTHSDCDKARPTASPSMATVTHAGFRGPSGDGFA
jgi:catechol 2,3-dioxygenase-like lactoylglutathione lyase family enzyme